MNKRIFALLMIVACLPLFCGCQLAIPEAGETQRDQLVGVYITINQSLSPVDYDPFEQFMKSDMEKIIDNIGEVVDGIIPDLASREEERIYGELTYWVLTSTSGEKYNRPKYEFPGIDGVQLAAYMFTYDSNGEPRKVMDSYVDEEVEDFNYTINQVGISEITATVYIDSNVAYSGIDRFECVSFYLNPIFQTESGEVYVLPNDASPFNVTQENALGGTTLKISETYTDEYGETQETKVAVTVKLDEPAETVDFIQMDSDNNVLCEDTFASTELPDTFTPRPDTAYIIVEQHSKNSIEHSTYDQDDHFVEVPCSGDSELLSFEGTVIMWPGDEI